MPSSDHLPSFSDSGQVALAIHTCSPELGLALQMPNGQQRLEIQDLGLHMAEAFPACLPAFLEPHRWSDVAYLAVAIGPGSFTGTRIGVVAARTLASQLKIPLFGISTLAAAAFQQCDRQNLSDKVTVTVEMPARRGQLYGGLYQVDLTHGAVAIAPDRVTSSEAWEAQIAQCNAPTIQRLTVADCQGKDVEAVLTLATFAWQRGDRPDWSTVLPYYGQSPV